VILFSTNFGNNILNFFNRQTLASHEVAIGNQIYRRMLQFFLPSYFYSQIWLNSLLDDHHFRYITNLRKIASFFLLWVVLPFIDRNIWLHLDQQMDDFLPNGIYRASRMKSWDAPSQCWSLSLDEGLNYTSKNTNTLHGKR
jgi:hypothetical protein